MRSLKFVFYHMWAKIPTMTECFKMSNIDLWGFPLYQETAHVVL